MTSRSFSLVDLVAGAVMVFLLIAITHALPGCGPSNRALHSTQLRAIHSAMVLYPVGSLYHYPGHERDRPVQRNLPGIYATATTDSAEPAYRYAILLNGGFLSPEDCVSPLDAAAKTPPKPGTILTSANYSYAMLRISDPSASGRMGEWCATNNPRAAVLSDRNLGSAAGPAAQSVHQKQWAGFVCYNDNHVNFEASNVIRTEYNFKGEIPADDLFADDNDKDGNGGNDAAMVYQDAKTYVDQR